MGLPLAAVYADVTGNVTGVDVDKDVVETVSGGDCHIVEEPGLSNLVAETVDQGSLRATTDSRDAAQDSSLHVIIVPTLVDNNNIPDLSIVETVVQDIAPGLEVGDQVFIESTVPPTTCRDTILPLLERESSLSKDEFGLAFCPERTASGRALKDIRGAYPKIVGGIDAESSRVALLVYEQINSNDVLVMSDATTAESVKIFEGLFRDVNIALANEIARLADILKVDTREAIEAANTISFINLHDPGPGVGGHCIPYYPYFIMSLFDTETPLLRTARDLNDEMPSFAVDKLKECLEDNGISLSNATVAILGLTYRANVKEMRATPSRKIAAQLSTEGADVFLVDPLLEKTDEFAGVQISLEEFQSLDIDAAVLAAAHDEFSTIDWNDLQSMTVIDGRNALDLDNTHHSVYTIGSGFSGGSDV